MIRKYLFLGLTGLLGAVVVWMVITTREMGKGAGRGPAEVTRVARPTPTKAFSPLDLELLECTVEYRAAEDPAQQQLAVHRLVIRNRGTVPYKNLLLDLSYLGGAGETVGERKVLVAGDGIAPGQILELDGLKIEAAPQRAAACTARIISAEIGAVEAGKNAQAR